MAKGEGQATRGVLDANLLATEIQPQEHADGLVALPCEHGGLAELASKEFAQGWAQVAHQPARLTPGAASTLRESQPPGGTGGVDLSHQSALAS